VLSMRVKRGDPGELSLATVQVIDALLLISSSSLFGGSAIGKQARQPFQRRGFPPVQLVRVDAIFGRNLVDRLVFFQQFLHELGFEFRAISLSHVRYSTLIPARFVSRFWRPLYSSPMDAVSQVSGQLF